jgi:hypothetical protein
MDGSDGSAGKTVTTGTVYQSGYWHADFDQANTHIDCFPFYYALKADTTITATYPKLCPAGYMLSSTNDVLLPNTAANTATSPDFTVQSARKFPNT